MSNHTKTSFPPWGIEEWGLGGPLILLMRFTMILLGVTCDHSLGGSQVFTMFQKSLLKNGVLLGVPNALNLQKMGRVSPWLFPNLQKTTSLLGQNAIGKPCKKC